MCHRQRGEWLGSIPPSGGSRASLEVAARKSGASGRMCAARRIGKLSGRPFSHTYSDADLCFRRGCGAY